MVNSVFEGKKSEMAAKIKRILIQTSKMAISIDIDSLNTKLLIFGHFVKLFLFKVTKHDKMKKKSQMTEYIDIAFSYLVFSLTTM